MDVFISWTRADEDVKNVIVNKLREANISCWDSDLHCVSDFADECIAAIRQSKVFIVIVSDASMETGYVQNEIKEARDQESLGKLNILVYKITDAPYTNQFAMYLNHISFVTGNFIQRVSSVAGISGIDKIVNRAQALLKKRKEGNPEKPYDVFLPQIDGLKLTKAGYFVEGSREPVLRQMEEGIRNSNVLILSEFFGYGKRSIIKKFVEQSRGKYTTAVMVHNEHTSLREFFAFGLKFLNVNENVFADLSPDDLVQKKFKFLERLDRQTLLVIPDVQFEDLPDTELCELLAGLDCHVLLLTQGSAEGYGDWFPVIKVGRMEDAHLQELFFHHYARAFEEEQENLTEPLTKFFDNIGGHTKTVELMAATLNRELRVPPEELPRYLSVHSDEGMQLKDRILQQIGSVLDVDRLGVEACIALLVAAYIAVPYTSETNYRAVLAQCTMEDWQVVVELDKQRWLDVDTHNKTVSMEPLVAQIVLSKLPDIHFIMCRCLEHLIDRYTKYVSFTASASTAIPVWNKLAYFFTVTGLPECAGIPAQLRQYAIEDSAYDTGKMAEAIRQFEMAHPLTAEEEDSEGQETEDGEAQAIPDRRDFEDRVVGYIRAMLPHARMITREFNNLVFDFSFEGSRVVNSTMNTQLAGSVDMFHAIGMSKEEFAEIKEDCEALLENIHEQDEDSVAFAVFMECLAVINGIYHRDVAQTQHCMGVLLAHLRELPMEMLSEDMWLSIRGAFKVVIAVCVNSGSLSAAISFCEKLLQLQLPEQTRVSALCDYVELLRSNCQYVPALYEAYEEVLANYDKAARDVFDLHTEMLDEKKAILLKYAEDLAKGERIDEALAQFAAARKLKTKAHSELDAACAHGIVDVLVKLGGFRQALAFVEQHFPPELVEKLAKTGDKRTQDIMEEFRVYRTVGQFTDNAFTQDTDPKKYISYYQEYSRKNNGLLEKKYLTAADQALDYDFSDLTDEELRGCADELRKRARKEKMLRLAPEAFALASEAGCRVLGYRHHMVQYMGAMAMAEGEIAEIFNGEGKTYTILLTAFLHHLYGRQVFVVDQSPYLTSRNYQWMRGVYDLLGVPNTQLTEMRWQAGNACSVVYADLKTYIMAYLNHELRSDALRSEFPMDTVILDEADTILVDMAQTPFRIVNSHNSAELYFRAKKVWNFVSSLPEEESLYTCEDGKKILLKSAIYPRIEAFFSVSYTDVGQLDKIRTIEQSIIKALQCRWCYELDKDYFIHNDVPVYEDRAMGTFQEMEAERTYYLCKENGLATRRVESEMTRELVTCNAVYLRDFFKRFRCVCGTTATAVSFREEFREIYGLDCFCVPTHSPVIRENNQSPLYTTLWAKERAILELVAQKVATKQPVLLVTQSTQESERYSRLLKRRRIPHKLLNAKNADAFSDTIAWAGVSGSVLVANTLAGRGADIKLGGNPELKTRQELVEMGEDITQLDSFVYRLPTPEQKTSALYQKYYSILEKNKALCAADRQLVVAAGGLCVIGTGFFPEPRIEQQTRGRSGRQGEVGESWVFQSVEDEQIQPLFNSAVRSWLDEQLRDLDVEEMDFPILMKAVQNGQKRMHRSMFAGIRQVNKVSQYLEKAREDFIGRRFALREGTLSPEMLLREWARDKAVLEQLQKLQKGEAPCMNPAVRVLYEKYPQLKTVRGGRASEALCDVAIAQLQEKVKAYGESFVGVINRWYDDRLQRSWAAYISIVENTVGRVDMTQRALEQFLDREKQRLLREPAELLILGKLRKR